jgi:hypothetical protein
MPPRGAAAASPLCSVEVLETRVVRNLARRRRHRAHGDARQAEVDEVGNALHRAHLDLRHECTPELLGRQVRTRGKHEHGGIVQRLVGHHTDPDAEVHRAEWTRRSAEHRPARYAPRKQRPNVARRFSCRYGSSGQRFAGSVRGQSPANEAPEAEQVLSTDLVARCAATGS